MATVAVGSAWSSLAVAGDPPATDPVTSQMPTSPEASSTGSLPARAGGVAVAPKASVAAASVTPARARPTRPLRGEQMGGTEALFHAARADPSRRPAKDRLSLRRAFS